MPRKIPEAVMAQIRAVLTSDAWTYGEAMIIKWQFGLLGDFSIALFEAIARADDINLDRLAKGFPDEVAAFRAWSSGDLAPRLRAAGLDI